MEITVSHRSKHCSLEEDHSGVAFRRAMLSLPSEIVSEILSFVPAQSLLRFRCVSKSWRALIDSRYFIKLHLTRAIQNNSDRTVFCLYQRIHMVYCYSQRRFRGDIDVVRCYRGDFDMVEDLFLECEPYTHTEIIGSCHGVLCLYGFGYYDEIALWNPMTRKAIELPSSNLEISREQPGRRIQGFGYDEVTDDYKVVRIWPGVEAEVFSLKSNSWRSISPFPYHMKFGYEGFGVLAGGSLHWVVYPETGSKKTYSIAAFDLGTEEYRLVPQPDYPYKKYFLHLTVLGESLCAYTAYRDPYDDSDRYDDGDPYDYGNPYGDTYPHFDFWVMKKYGCKDSWTKLFTYSSSTPFKVRPLAYSRSGRQLLMLEGNEQFWYDLETGEVKFSTKANSVNLDYSHMCFGSLVQLDGSISDDVMKATHSKKRKLLPI